MAGISEFERLQYFTHGKGYLVLNELRNKVGKENFDKQIEAI